MLLLRILFIDQLHLADPLLKLVMQEQRLHCNSIFTYLANPRINVTVDVKKTQLTLKRQAWGRMRYCTSGHISKKLE